MAFAKGRAFVILNRMAESGNSEAKKILGNLNSMPQEDLDSKLSTLFGKGGASKEGDVAPKETKGDKAPEGKEDAPKGEKGAKEGKVVANKDFDPNKKGVQSIFGTEEENAKSKDKKVYDTMEEVMGKEAPKTDKPMDKSAKFDNLYEAARRNMIASGKTKPEVLQDMLKVAQDDKDDEAAGIINSMLGKEAPKEMKSAKEGIKPLDPIQKDEDFKGKGGYTVDGIGKGGKDYLGKRKFMTEPNSEVDREINDVMQSSDSNEERLAGIAALREKYEGNKVNLAALDKLEQEVMQEDSGEIAPTQNTDAFGTSKEMGGGIGGGQKDLLGKKTDMADPNRPDIQAEMEQEMEDQLSGTGTDFEDAEGLALAFETVKKRFANDPQRLAALEKLEAQNPNASLAKGSATNPMTSAKEGIKPIQDAKRKMVNKVILKSIPETENAVNELIKENPDVANELKTVLSFIQSSANSKKIDTANEWFMQNDIGNFIDGYSGDRKDRANMQTALIALRKKLGLD